MQRNALIAWILCLGLLASLAQADTQSGASVRTIELEIANTPFELEYVADPDSRRKGLMGRKDLPADTGMLFDFPPGTRPAIWMRNMHISLDLVYIDDRGRIAQIFSDVPPCRFMPCEVYQAQQPLRFVLEVPAGTAARLELAVGQTLPLGDLLTQPAPRY